jgi:hypothetical protein
VGEPGKRERVEVLRALLDEWWEPGDDSGVAQPGGSEEGGR